MTSQQPNTLDFVTLFDSGFMPQAMCLYRSLRQHCRQFRLYVLTLDETAQSQLEQLNAPEIHILALQDYETPELKAVKPGRSRAEYCWTLTSCVLQWILDGNNDVERLTYVDADIFFLKSPQALLDTMEAAGRSVLITEHGYAPEYDQSHVSGRYCVQIISFDNQPAAREVLDWWQARCIEWCFALPEDGKFGDQKYLERWPELFGDRVHIVADPQLTLAPWNAKRFSPAELAQGVLFHFHGLRTAGGNMLMASKEYDISNVRNTIYREYCATMGMIKQEFDARGWPWPRQLPPVSLRKRISHWIAEQRGRRRAVWMHLPVSKVAKSH